MCPGAILRSWVWSSHGAKQPFAMAVCLRYEGGRVELSWVSPLPVQVWIMLCSFGRSLHRELWHLALHTDMLMKLFGSCSKHTITIYSTASVGLNIKHYENKITSHSASSIYSNKISTLALCSKSCLLRSQAGRQAGRHPPCRWANRTLKNPARDLNPEAAISW